MFKNEQEFFALLADIRREKKVPGTRRIKVTRKYHGWETRRRAQGSRSIGEGDFNNPDHRFCNEVKKDGVLLWP